MLRRILILCAITCATAVPAFAQNSPGIRVGLSGDPDQFIFGGHIETAPLLERLTFRPNVEVGIGDDVTSVGLNFEFVYSIPIDRQPWRVYFGGGPAANFYSFDDRDSDVGGGFNILVGAQHRGGLFTEFKVGTIDSPNVKFVVGYAFK